MYIWRIYSNKSKLFQSLSLPYSFREGGGGGGGLVLVKHIYHTTHQRKVNSKPSRRLFVFRRLNLPSNTVPTALDTGFPLWIQDTYKFTARITAASIIVLTRKKPWTRAPSTEIFHKTNSLVTQIFTNDFLQIYKWKHPFFSRETFAFFVTYKYVIYYLESKIRHNVQVK